MITYPDGTEIGVSDAVLMNHGREPGVVRAVVDSPEKMEHWGVDEIGLMIECEKTGLCYWPARSLDKDEIKLISRSGK